MKKNISIIVAIIALVLATIITIIVLSLNLAAAKNITPDLPDKAIVDSDFTTVMNLNGLVVKEAIKDGDKVVWISNYSDTEYLVIGNVEKSNQHIVEHIKPNEYKVYTFHNVFNEEFECRIDFLTDDCKGVPPYIVGIREADSFYITQ